MPITQVTATPSERLTPKSMLRHRPIASETKTQGPAPVPRASRASRTSHTQPSIHTQTPRPAPKQTTGSVSVDVPVWKQANKTHSSPFSHLLPGMAVGMMLAVVLVMLAQWLIGWAGNTWNDLHYGYPRTYQIDAVVGHQDSAAHPSHFLALNLQGQVEILEFPGGDVAHTKVYVGPQLSGPEAALLPVTLRFVTPAHASLPNMVVIVGSSQFVFVNAHGTFISPGTTQP